MELKKRISLILILIINIIFLIKYVERVTNYYITISLIISIGYYLIYHFRNILNTKVNFKRILFFVLIFCYIILSLFLFDLIPQSTLNVDRYSVINSFWDSFLNSDYAYAAKSHQGNFPGPMPFYFLLAFPFYLTGELGYFSLFGLIIFAVLLKYSKVNINNQITGILLITLSAFYLWETISRSNIFLNSSLILLSILFFINSLNMNRKKHIMIHGIIIGLLLSTRNVLILPYIVLFIYLLKNKIYNLIDFLKISVIILITFTITFLPFVINHFQSFLEINPFIIQSSILMPSWLSFVCIIMTSISFFLIKQKDEIFFFSGIFLFLTILIYFFYLILIHGFQNTLFGSIADISYFILCVPFLLYFLLNENRKNDEQIDTAKIL
jgi:hypothetical protein